MTIKKIFFVLLGTFLLGCKKNSETVTPAKGYFRTVILDAPSASPTTGKVQFYFDGKININGDSSFRKPDGTLFTQDPGGSNVNSVTVNYPFGGVNDNPDPALIGVYAFDNQRASRYSYFPNATHRIDLAPILLDRNYFGWAAIPGGEHFLEFKRVEQVSIYGTVVEVPGQSIFKKPYPLEAGAIQTSFLYNTSAAKYFPYGTFVKSRLDYKGRDFYETSKFIDFFQDTYDVATITDHPAAMTRFSDSVSYIRFVNFTPAYQDQGVNEQTSSLDFYISPISGPKTYLEAENPFAPGGEILSLSIGNPILVAAGVKRFDNSVDAPFFGIDMAPYMRGDTANRPKYFRVLAYRNGQSAATGDAPLASADWLAIYNLWTDRQQGQHYTSWLLHSNGERYFPTVNTICVAVGTGDSKTQGGGGPLLIRSVIQYPQQGTDAVYLQRSGN